MITPVAPSLAATLMLVRDHAGLEVLMVERHGGLLFGPGATVFPGGKLDAQDIHPALWPYIVGQPKPDAESCGLRICAIRETFEETGILLSEPQIDGACGGQEQDLRRQMITGRLSFRQVVATLGVTLNLATLTPFARWVTPPEQPIRFDAVFYIARAPVEHVAVCDGRETIAAEWMTPARALALADSGRLKLMRPTRVNLALLAASPSVAEAIASAAARPIETVF